MNAPPRTPANRSNKGKANALRWLRAGAWFQRPKSESTFDQMKARPKNRKKPPAGRKKSPAAAVSKNAAKKNNPEKNWNLRLYVAGQTPKSLAAFSNLKRLCDEHLAGHYDIEIVDLMKQPHLAQGDQIVALPTLVRKLPEPIKRIIGDLSNLERVKIGLDLQFYTKK